MHIRGKGEWGVPSQCNDTIRAMRLHFCNSDDVCQEWRDDNPIDAGQVQKCITNKHGNVIAYISLLAFFNCDFM